MERRLQLYELYVIEGLGANCTNICTAVCTQGVDAVYVRLCQYAPVAVGEDATVSVAFGIGCYCMNYTRMVYREKPIVCALYINLVMGRGGYCVSSTYVPGGGERRLLDVPTGYTTVLVCIYGTRTGINSTWIYLLDTPTVPTVCTCGTGEGRLRIA